MEEKKKEVRIKATTRRAPGLHNCGLGQGQVWPKIPQGSVLISSWWWVVVACQLLFILNTVHYPVFIVCIHPIWSGINSDGVPIALCATHPTHPSP